MPSTPTPDEVDRIHARGLLAIARVVSADPIWVPIDDEDGPELTEVQQRAVDELHRLNGLVDGQLAVAMALDVLREQGNTAVVEAFVADEYEAALDEDQDRHDAYWTGAGTDELEEN